MKYFRLAVHPFPEIEKADTSLRYTDILFGFVIRELFFRLRNFPELDTTIEWHLIIGTTLVLGSWIGFRRSLNRSSYTVKFFNLPFFKFLVDQAMLVLYFRLAVMTDVDPKLAVADASLVIRTIELVTYVFVLYFVWDVLGIWMTKAKYRSAPSAGKPRYPAVENEATTGKPQMTDKPHSTDWIGISITSVVLLLFALVWCKAPSLPSSYASVATFVLLLAYRFAKEVRTSSKSPSAAAV